MEEDKISVIVPVYNVDKYLKKCIESIISQTYKNIEIIFIDDGSTDNSGKILDEYKINDKRIIVVHKENGGVSSARNVGIDNASGKYICFADSDDFLSNDYVEYLHNLIVKYNADISLTTEMFGNFNEKQIEKESIKIYNGEETTEAILCYKIPIGVYSKMFKAELIKERIKFLSELFIGEGFNFNVTAFQRANKIVISNKKIYYYRRDNSTSATTVFSKGKCENGLLALEIMRENFIIKTERILKAWKFAKWRTYTDIFDMIVLGNAQKNYKILYDDCKKNIRQNAFNAFKVPTTNKQRIRALVMKFFPNFIPIMLIVRRKIYRVNIERCGENNER